MKRSTRLTISFVCLYECIKINDIVFRNRRKKRHRHFLFCQSHLIATYCTCNVMATLECNGPRCVSSGVITPAMCQTTTTIVIVSHAQSFHLEHPKWTHTNHGIPRENQVVENRASGRRLADCKLYIFSTFFSPRPGLKAGPAFLLRPTPTLDAIYILAVSPGKTGFQNVRCWKC